MFFLSFSVRSVKKMTKINDQARLNEFKSLVIKKHLFVLFSERSMSFVHRHPFSRKISFLQNNDAHLYPMVSDSNDDDFFLDS